jgi:hypothetical protein
MAEKTLPEAWHEFVITCLYALKFDRVVSWLATLCYKIGMKQHG